MNNQLRFEFPDLPVSLLAVNERGYESGNDAASQESDLPLLQDTAEEGVWDAYDAVYRDVQILDADNAHVGTFNLTDNSLSDEANYEALKEMLIDAASQR